MPKALRPIALGALCLASRLASPVKRTAITAQRGVNKVIFLSAGETLRLQIWSDRIAWVRGGRGAGASEVGFTGATVSYRGATVKIPAP